MIKRKSTLDQTEKAKRNKQVEVFSILDICLRTHPLMQKSQPTTASSFAIAFEKATTRSPTEFSSANVTRISTPYRFASASTSNARKRTITLG